MSNNIITTNDNTSLPQFQTLNENLLHPNYKMFNNHHSSYSSFSSSSLSSSKSFSPLLLPTNINNNCKGNQSNNQVSSGSTAFSNQFLIKSLVENFEDIGLKNSSLFNHDTQMLAASPASTETLLNVETALAALKAAAEANGTVNNKKK